MTLDCHLLRDYAENGSEEAFAELVRRYVDLVYSAALRQVNGDAHLAQDVAQTVFAELSRQAKRLSQRRVLSGWLYTCACFVAAKAVRTERRRCAREKEAQAMNEPYPSEPSELDWQKLQPVLDQVMIQLSEPDREALLLRFFEKKKLAEIGQHLGVGEDAARKRVERALEKLRSFLARRGITTTAAITAAISANAVQAAPVGLAAALATSSVAAPATATAVTFPLLKMLTMTKLQFSIVGAVVIGGIATPVLLHQQAQAELRKAQVQLQAQTAQLAEQRAENERLSRLLSQAPNAAQLSNNETADLLRLRNEVGALRRQTNEYARVQADNQRLRTSLVNPPRADAGQNNSPDTIQKDSWAFLGYADPESAFQSAVWAMNHGDAKTFMASHTPDSPILKQALAKTESEVAAENKAELEKITGYKIIDKQTVSDSEVILTMYGVGEGHTTKFSVKRIGNEWKLFGPVRP